MFRTQLVLFVTLLSSVILAAEDKSKRIVMLIGEDEYHTWETLPEFGKSVLEPLGYAFTVIQADPKDLNNFPGLVEALKTADVLLLSTKRRLLPKDQVDAVREFLNAGKPLVGIRNASHAFALPRNMKDASKVPEGHVVWAEFDPEVLGGHYDNHYGPSKPVEIAPAKDASEHPILKDVNLKEWVGHGTLYRANGLVATCTPLLMGSIADKPAEPIAWTNVYGPNKAKVFYTSLGHPDDFKEAAFRKMLSNAIAWALAK